MIKKLLVMCVMLSLIMPVFAQITEGNYLIGGGLSFTAENRDLATSNLNTNSFTLSPTGGYFVVDKLVVGTQLLYGLLSQTSNSVTTTMNSFSVAPFSRYYFETEVLKPYIFVGVGKSWETVSYGGSSSTNHTTRTFWNAGVGADYFINKSIALEAQLNYTSKKYNSDAPYKIIGFTFGIQVFLDNEKKD